MKPLKSMRDVLITGIGLTAWRYHENVFHYDIGSEAVMAALEDAEMEWKEIQAVFCGSVYQGTASGHQVIKEVGFTGIPIVNVENACSSSGSAFRLAYQSIAAEIYDKILVLGVEVMPRGPIPSTAFRPWELASGFNVQPANYANLTVQYMKSSGATLEDLGLVTVKNRKNGALNKKARFQKPVTLEEVMESKMIATPLRLLHCCPLADGGAAIILSSRRNVKNRRRAVQVLASTLTSAGYGEGYIDLVDSLKYPPSQSFVSLSAHQAYQEAGCGPSDIDIVQAYDTVSPSELWDLEELGFCSHGEAHVLLRQGHFDLHGKLPVNTDGGLMSRGHPLGATSAGQLCEIVTQIRGEAGVRQIENARTGLAHSMGAGPNSSVTILRK
ncbi:MAG: thiolase family protein [Syntrophaceae bacterium]|nr:thiolase family protein [Syntrophaceae bacterium]